MELILTHTVADFDAFASMLLANKLYPQAVPILPSNTIYKLREVLSLYRDVADFNNIRYLKKYKNLTLDRIIVVDTKKRGKLQEFSSYLKMANPNLLIFDHHPPTSDDLAWGILEQFPYGGPIPPASFSNLPTGIPV